MTPDLLEAERKPPLSFLVVQKPDGLLDTKLQKSPFSPFICNLESLQIRISRRTRLTSHLASKALSCFIPFKPKGFITRVDICLIHSKSLKKYADVCWPMAQVCLSLIEICGPRSFGRYEVQDSCWSYPYQKWGNTVYFPSITKLAQTKVQANITEPKG